jgi:hypothetical protein
MLATQACSTETTANRRGSHVGTVCPRSDPPQCSVLQSSLPSAARYARHVFFMFVLDKGVATEIFLFFSLTI